MNSRVIFFDIDDTLLDDAATKRKYVPAFYNLYRDRINFLEDDFPKIWKDAIERNFNRYVLGELTYENQRRQRIREIFEDESMNDENADAILDSFDRCFRNGWTISEGTVEVLKKLKSLRLGVISNGAVEMQHDKLHRLGIYHYFENITVSEEVGVTKPDKKIFLKACEKMNCKPEDCLYVGDDFEKDVKGALNVGMKAVWFNRNGETRSGDFEEIRSMKELISAKTIYQ